ncbi:hypothetical protein SAY86_005216 [Trapa natans]|uniref:H15 domain-containing protein n=1 Tax=Trapa natans TaxID=22666 RepID=A0AAN7L579_TRANT|nr:hypothetical protein SAY86_005216 [Trapa natans]
MASSDVNKPQSLPPYPEMIIAALEALKDDNGSNKSSISKYIESKYVDLPADHSQLLSVNLTKMKESGELAFLKNNYMKSEKAPPHRGRGRPPKPKEPLSPPIVVQLPSRPRGRPPKDRNTPNSTKSKVASSTGRPRGRPRKMAKPTRGLGGSVDAGAVPTPSKRPRGRPPKVKAASTEVSVEI